MDPATREAEREATRPGLRGAQLSALSPCLSSARTLSPTAVAPGLVVSELSVLPWLLPASCLRAFTQAVPLDSSVKGLRCPCHTHVCPCLTHPIVSDSRGLPPCPTQTLILETPPTDSLSRVSPALRGPSSHHERPGHAQHPSC